VPDTSLLNLDDFRGGVNDSDSPTKLQPTQIVGARNVDFRDGALGAKRRGTAGIDMTSAAFDAELIAVMRHTPTDSVGNDELWGIDANGNIDRRVGGTWQGGVTTVNDHVAVNAGNYLANGVSLHGKFFIAAEGDEDRLLVWDGSVLRWAGIQQPPVPTLGDQGTGTLTGTRYYRVRYTQQVSGVTVRRSEPTDVVNITPSGSGASVRVTKASGTEATTSVFMEGQTHWEVEASLDNILFYRIATVAIGTATYDDSTAFTTGYSSNTLSEPIGTYAVPTSAKFVTVDEDRVLMAGAYFTAADDATVWWTPVSADPGVGNDERVPITTLNFISFDGLDGGGTRGLVAGVNGAVYVFKTKRVYKMVRTGILESAYDPITESTARGSTPKGAVAGLDANGLPCVYFLDPSKGLCRIGTQGVQDLGQQIRDTWQRWNNQATVQPQIVHYPELDQVWYAVPLDEADAPDLTFVFETRFNAPMYHDGRFAQALCFTLFPDADDVLRPVMGTEEIEVTGGVLTVAHFCDTGTTDGGTEYQGYTQSRIYVIGDLWNKFGVMAGILLGRASSGATISITMTRNFSSTDSVTVTASLTPVGAEPRVIVPMDDASISELNALQFQIGDASASAQAWSLDQLVLRLRAEGVSG
jgi:hypothetical protein